MRKYVALLLAVSVLTACFYCAGCGNPNTPVSKSGFYFDTVIEVTLYGHSNEALLDDCFSLAEKYEKLFSNTVAESDISRINHAAGEPVTVDDETIALLEKGIEYGKLSDGAFDITIGTLSKLWNFSTKSMLAETDSSMIPASDEIKDALASVDYRAVKIDGNKVSLTNKDALLDLGGIAKGYIADQMKQYLIAHGVKNGYINLGGNVLCIGSKPDSSPYRIGIQMPFGQGNEMIASVELSDKTVVSSGVYERNFMADGKLYHHILDTSTGYPYENGLLGVTIITDSSADGDALSTTCFSLGIKDGMELIERLPGTEAIFITEDYALHKSSGIGTDIPLREEP